MPLHSSLKGTEQAWKWLKILEMIKNLDQKHTQEIISGLRYFSAQDRYENKILKDFISKTGNYK